MGSREEGRMMRKKYDKSATFTGILQDQHLATTHNYFVPFRHRVQYTENVQCFHYYFILIKEYCSIPDVEIGG